VSISTYAAYLAKIDKAQRAELVLSSTSRAAGAAMLWSQWTTNPAGAGAAPSAAVVPTNLTQGSIGQVNAGASGLRLARAVINTTSAAPYSLILCDRLSHQGGLSSAVTTAQTTNLPTAALTRSTDGVGVMAALEIYTTLGNTATTWSASYTNQAGTAGRTSIASVLGGTGAQEQLLNKFQIMPLQAGDFGVKSVENVTVLASTTVAGNFGITLFRPLMTFPGLYTDVQEFDAILGLGANLHLIPQDACLFWLAATTIGTIPAHHVDLKFIEDAAP
jgi:hypothetical protein